VAETGDRRPPAADGDERTILLSFLDYLRETVSTKADGISEQAARTPGVCSGTNVLGLIQHMTAGEVYWFRYIFEAEEMEPVDFGMTVPESDSIEDVVADYRAAVERSNQILSECSDLGEMSQRPDHRGHVSMRWILVHLIEETARHAGHADILCEQIDGSVGR
jgi:uncharacterized damage-inducible protein DinB